MLSSEPEKGFAYEKADFLGNSGCYCRKIQRIQAQNYSGIAMPVICAALP